MSKKHIIIGDLHGKELQCLENVITAYDPDSLICVGDFDQARTIRQYMTLEKSLLDKGKGVITVAGNHDVALISGPYINSDTMRRQGKDFFELYDELRADPAAHTYLEKLVNQESFKKSIDLEATTPLSTIIMHAALTGSLESYPRCPPEETDVWFRLLDEECYWLNFHVMGQEGINVMIRGHDHAPRYASLDDQGLQIVDPKERDSYELHPDGLHTINPGALFDGWFATLETSPDTPPLLAYHRL